MSFHTVAIENGDLLFLSSGAEEFCCKSFNFFVSTLFTLYYDKISLSSDFDTKFKHQIL